MPSTAISASAAVAPARASKRSEARTPAALPPCLRRRSHRPIRRRETRARTTAPTAADDSAEHRSVSTPSRAHSRHISRACAARATDAPDPAASGTSRSLMTCVPTTRVEGEQQRREQPRARTAELARGAARRDQRRDADEHAQSAASLRAPCSTARARSRQLEAAAVNEISRTRTRAIGEADR